MCSNLTCSHRAYRHEGTSPQYNAAHGLQSLNRVGNPYQQQPGWSNQLTSPWDGDWNESQSQNTVPWGPQASNQWNGRYNGNPRFSANGYCYNPPQFQQPVGGLVQVQNSWKGCKVIGGDSSVGGIQQNGHLGLSKVEEDRHSYEDCTVGPGGKQLNGSANGRDGLAVASIFWGDAKKIESKNIIRGEIDKLLSWRLKKSDEGRNF